MNRSNYYSSSGVIILTIRNKILLVILAAWVAAILIIFGSARIFLLSRFAEVERQHINENMLRFSDALQNDSASLDKEAGDWACWDDTYQFMETRDSNYILKNLADDTFVNLGLNLFLYVNKSKNIVYGKLFDLQNGREIFDNQIKQQIISNDILLPDTDQNRSKTGILLLSQGLPVLVAAHPILTSELKGPNRGTLIIGRFLNHYEIKRLAQITHLPVEVESYGNFMNKNQTKQLGLRFREPILIQPLNNKEILGSLLLSDLSGEPALVAYVTLPRSIYEQGRNGFYYLLIGLICIGIIIAFLMLIVLGKLVTTRLVSINSFINRIGASGDLSIRLPVRGNDELTNFTRVMNQMMDSLEQSHLNLEENRQRLIDIIEFFPDAILVIDESHKAVAWNRAMEAMTGIKKEEMLGQGDYAYAVPFYGKPRPLLIDLVSKDLVEMRLYYPDAVKNGSVVHSEIYVTITGQHHGVYLETIASPLFHKGALMGAIQSIRNITIQKKAEEGLKYLSLHDQLTGLYNRAYFEEEVRRLDTGDNMEVGVIMCDVDGLKLVNDSLGHSAGDRLLQAAAVILKKSFRDNYVVARIGGDEFAILISQSNAKVLEAAVHRIEKAITHYNENSPELPMSISLGWAFRKEPAASLKSIIDEADNKMYHEKMHRSRSAHSAIVQTLMKTLRTRDFSTEVHGERLKKLVVELSHQIGLPEQKIHDLSLLAQFHDIGKVGIPDQILFKPGPLTLEEWVIMSRHAEIGYNIAQSAQELLHISDWILTHHERWDGQGYPRGLKGEEIPLECRILSIADAYDAMISERPYRKAMSQQEAVTELCKWAGTHFDPELVKEFVKIIGEKTT